MSVTHREVKLTENNSLHREHLTKVSKIKALSQLTRELYNSWRRAIFQSCSRQVFRPIQFDQALMICIGQQTHQNEVPCDVVAQRIESGKDFIQVSFRTFADVLRTLSIRRTCAFSLQTLDCAA